MSDKKYFDLHVTGLGYLNRVREVEVRKGPGFLAADISALRGDSDEVEYTKFDCRVSGEEAQRVIRRAIQAANDPNRKVLIGFKIGDIYAETFTYTKGDKAGTTGVSLKGRLLQVKFVKVDGESVYTAPKTETANAVPEVETAVA